MCGIVGYIGQHQTQAADVLIKGLKRLEYRGYDSAGIAVVGDHLQTIKSVGRITNLEAKVNEKPPHGQVGIGHTRWATHGAPSDINSHPHTSTHSKFTVVHNGILENYQELKAMLQTKGYTFVSETDTEVIANYLDHDYQTTNDVLTTLRHFHEIAVGSFALGVIFENQPTLYAAKKQSPLVIGLGQGENFLASDVAAVLDHTKNYYLLEEHETAVITPGSVQLYDKQLCPVTRDIYTVDWDISAAEKGGYDHFMLKEIYEQPTAIQNTLNPRITSQGGIDLGIDLDATHINKVHIVACGSATHAGLVGKHILESMARISSEVVAASEFRYQDPIIHAQDVVIIISQSGETADTLAALRHAKQAGATTLAIVNVLGSSIAREADHTLFTWAGPEIAVATTKAYSAQVILMYLLAITWANQRGLIDTATEKSYVKELLKLPAKVNQALENLVEPIKAMVTPYNEISHLFFIGRGMDYAAVLEGSLKLKEISYIHSEAYPAGELKHGTISLIEPGTPVIASITQHNTLEKTLSNLQEVMARGAQATIITTEGTALHQPADSQVITVPSTLDYFTPTLTAIPMQLFSYYLALARGCDIDMPRNLAKSVTVE